MHHFYRWHIANFHPPEKLKYLPSNSFYYACKYYWEKTTSFWNRYKGWNIQLLLDQALLDTTKTTCWSPKTFPVCILQSQQSVFPQMWTNVKFFHYVCLNFLCQFLREFIVRSTYEKSFILRNSSSFSISNLNAYAYMR